MSKSGNIIPAERIIRGILVVRGQRVLLDADLAILYEVSAKRLNEAVKRNAGRFPSDFMFQLTASEVESLRSQFATSKGRGGRRYLPYAFTEHGVAMLASVLRSQRAVQVSIAIVRAFVQLRQLLATHADLAKRMGELEKKYDGQFAMVFDAIRALMDETAADEQKPPIGYHTELQKSRRRPRKK